MEQIIKLITDLGFPIACVIFLGWYTVRITTMYREDLKEILGKYMEAMQTSAQKDEEEAQAITRLEDIINEQSSL